MFLPGKNIKALQKRINKSTTDHLYLQSAANATQLKESLERITFMIKPEKTVFCKICFRSKYLLSSTSLFWEGSHLKTQEH